MASYVIKCDPRCGRGCTQAQYDRVKRRAVALQKRLGPSWTIRIWDNLGWHHEVVSKNKCIYVTDRFATTEFPVKRTSSTRYYAYISEEPGQPYVSYSGHGATPQEAVCDAADAVRSKIRQLAHTVKYLESIIKT